MSRTRPREEPSSVVEVQECPVCFEPMRPPVYQCCEGHLLCKGCIDRLYDTPRPRQKCPECRALLPVERVRNRLYDQLTRDALYSCSYAGNGCNVRMRHEPLTAHESTCDRRLGLCKCPQRECRDHEFTIASLRSHLQENHAGPGKVDADGSFSFSIFPAALSTSEIRKLSAATPMSELIPVYRSLLGKNNSWSFFFYRDLIAVAYAYFNQRTLAMQVAVFVTGPAKVKYTASFEAVAGNSKTTCSFEGNCLSMHTSEGQGCIFPSHQSHSLCGIHEYSCDCLEVPIGALRLALQSGVTARNSDELVCKIQLLPQEQA